MLTIEQALEFYFSPLSKYVLFGEAHTPQPFWLYREEALAEQGTVAFLHEVDLGQCSEAERCIIRCIRALAHQDGHLSTLDSNTHTTLLTLLNESTRSWSQYGRSVWLSLSLRDADKPVRKQALDFLTQNPEFTHKDCSVDFSYSNFTGLEQGKAKLDFTGQYLYGANFSKLNLKESKFEYSCLSHANFNGSHLKRAHLEGAWLDRANFTAVTLDSADFQHAQGLTPQSLKPAKSKKRIDSNNPSGDVANPSITDKIHTAALKYVEDEENVRGNHPDFPNWLEANRWGHDDYWNGDKPEQQTGKVCKLSPDDDLYQLVSRLVYSSSDAVTVKNHWLVNNQMITALREGNLGNIVHTILHRPQHEGFVGGISITKVEMVRNLQRWQAYQAEKQRIQKELQQGNHLPIDSSYFPWAAESLLPLPVIDKHVGEALLFHGVRDVNVMPLITQDGYKTDFMKARWLTGWGELGKGIYLAEEFSKSALHVFCPTCKVSPCRCPECKKPERKMFLNRALLGRTKEDRYHENTHGKVGKHGFHSSWGPVSQVTGSEFKHNEFCVPPEQVYPEFIITYQENPKTYQLQRDSHLPDPQDWQQQLNRGRLDQGNSPLRETMALLDNFHRLLCYRRQDTWSLEQQLHWMEQIIQAVQANANSNFDEKSMAAELQEKIKQEKHRLGLISTLPLQDYQQALFYFRKQQYAKVLPAIERLIQHQPHNLSFHWLLATVYYHLGANYHRPMVGALHRALKLNEGATRYWLQHHCSYGHTNAPSHQHALTTEQYYETAFTLLCRGNRVAEDQQDNDAWVEDVLKWHAEQALHAPSKQREIYDALPELLRQEFVPALLTLIPKTEDHRLRREFILSWPDVSGMRPLTRARKVHWLQTIEQALTQAKNPTGVKLHWLVETQNDIINSEAYLNEEHSQTLFDAAGRLIPNETQQNEQAQQGRCLVKACNPDNEPIAYVKFYPKYPLRQQFADELCFRLSGHGARTTIALLIHEKTKQVYPVLISQPLGIAPDPKETKQRHLLAWEFLRKDAEIESNLDNVLFTWKVFEAYLLQPKDEKNDNLFPFLNPHTQKYGFISGDADRILSQAPMQGDVVQLNSNIFLMDAMQDKLDPSAVKHFLGLDVKALLDGVMEHFKKLKTQLSALDSVCRQANHSMTLERFEAGRTIDISKQSIDTDSHLFRLFRDEDLSELYQRFMLLQQALDKIEVKGPMTHVQLIAELMPDCAKAYQVARDAEPTQLTSSPRFLQLNNKYTRLTKTVQVESPDGKSTVTRSTTYSKTEAPKKSVFSSSKTKEPLLPISRLSTQTKLLDNTHYLYTHLAETIHAIDTLQSLDKFIEAPSDFIREMVWNQMDWRKLKPGMQEKVLSLLPTFKCYRLRLAHCDVTDEVLRAHLRNNPHLTELYLVDCRLLTSAIMDVLSKLPNLKRLVINGMNWETIKTEQTFNPGVLPRVFIKEKEGFCNLRELKIKNCHHLTQFELYAPQLQSLALLDCEKLQLSPTILQRYAATLVHLWIENLIITNNHLTDITFEQLRWLECHQAQLQTIDIQAGSLITLDLDHCAQLNKIQTQSATLTHLNVSGCQHLTDATLQAIIATMNAKNHVIAVEIDERVQTIYPTLMRYWPMVFNYLSSKVEKQTGFLNQLERNLTTRMIQTNLLIRLNNDEKIALKNSIIKSSVNLFLLQNPIQALPTVSRDKNNYRAAAAGVLVKLGHESPGIIQALLTVLERDYYPDSIAAAIALGEFKRASPAVIEGLLAAFGETKIRGEQLRLAAAGALVKLGHETQDFIQALLTELRDGSVTIRAAAAGVLGNLSHAAPGVVDGLLVALKDDENYVRAAAAGALGELKQASSAVIEGLLTALGETNETDLFQSVRVAAAAALGELKQPIPAVIEGLLKLVRRNGHDDIIVHAVEDALVKLGHENPDVIEGLLIVLRDALGDKSQGVQNFAKGMGMLVKLGQKNLRVIQVLLNALEYTEEIDRYGFHVRAAAATALGELKRASPAVIEALLRVLRDEVIYVRAAAAGALGGLKRASPAVIEALLKVVEKTTKFDLDRRDRAAAAGALGELKRASSAVIRALLKVLEETEETDPYGQVLRIAAAGALVKLGHENSGVIEVLMAGLEDKSFWQMQVRVAAAGALGELKRPSFDIIRALVKMLEYYDNNVRVAAAGALGELKHASPAVIEGLLKAAASTANIATGPYRYLRAAAEGALVKLGHESPDDVIQALLKALGRETEEIDQYRSVHYRIAAAAALGELKQTNPDVIKGLLTALGDKNSNVRAAAAGALVKLGHENPDAIESLLTDVLGDKEYHVRAAAVSALGKIRKALQEQIADDTENLDDLLLQLQQKYLPAKIVVDDRANVNPLNASAEMLDSVPTAAPDIQFADILSRPGSPTLFRSVNPVNAAADSQFTENNEEQIMQKFAVANLSQ